MLCRWPWPGNIRELQNVIERAVILSRGPVLTVSRAEFETMVPTTSVPVTLEDAEREHILRALADTNWVIGGPSGAAARLGDKRTSLVSTMRRLHIVRPLRARRIAAAALLTIPRSRSSPPEIFSMTCGSCNRPHRTPRRTSHSLRRSPSESMTHV